MRHLTALICVLYLVGAIQAQTAPSYAKQIQPFFTRYCVECHSSQDGEGGLSLESFKKLLEGGTHGAAIVTGKPETSRLVRMIEGTLKPAMPPKKAKQPSKEEVALIRAWVLAGTRNDSTAVAKITLPTIAPKRRVETPVSALAYRPDGHTLAASGRARVILLDPLSGKVLQYLPVERDRVTASLFPEK